MPRLEFVGQSARDADFPQGNTSRLVNVYREPIGSMAGNAIKSVPGLDQFANLGELFGRDMATVDGQLYTLAGDTLFRVRADGFPVNLGATVSAEGAMIFGADDGNVCTVSDGRFFVWDGATMLEPTLGPFTDVGAGVFLGGYVILTQRNGREFMWSDLADATTWPGLNFATAESTDGKILRAIAINGRLWLMKEDVIEAWYVTGLSGAEAFAQITGGVIETGLKAAGLVTRFTGGVFFVGADGIAYISNGGQVQPISGPAVNTALAQGQPTDCFTYEDEGHIFCVVRFQDRPAWVYDIATGEWHERAAGDLDPWDIRVAAQAYGSWFGTDNFGRVFRFARTNRDGDQSLIRTMVTDTLQLEGRRFRVPMIEVGMRTGQPVTYPADPTQTDARIELSTSKDGGKTWSLPVTRSAGEIGQFDQLVRWRSLGSFYKLTVRLRMSDPAEIPLMSQGNVVIA